MTEKKFSGHQQGEDEEGRVAPPVVGELRREEVGAGDGRLRVAALITGPSSVEEHSLCLSFNARLDVSYHSSLSQQDIVNIVFY